MISIYSSLGNVRVCVAQQKQNINWANKFVGHVHAVYALFCALRGSHWEEVSDGLVYLSIASLEDGDHHLFVHCREHFLQLFDLLLLDTWRLGDCAGREERGQGLISLGADNNVINTTVEPPLTTSSDERPTAIIRTRLPGLK